MHMHIMYTCTCTCYVSHIISPIAKQCCKLYMYIIAILYTYSIDQDLNMQVADPVIKAIDSFLFHITFTISVSSYFTNRISRLIYSLNAYLSCANRELCVAIL